MQLSALILGTAIALAGVAVTITGCGQTGPLYLPPPQSAASR